MSCLVIMLPAEPLFRINLMDCPLTLASVYIVVIGLVSRAALLNNSVAAVSLNLNGKIVANDSSSVMVAGEILLVDQYPNSAGVIQMVAVKNWESVDGLPLPISSSVELFSVFGFYWVVSFGAVFGFVGVDRLFVAAVNILLVAAADKLEVDILETNRLMTTSLVDKQVGFDLGTDLEFGTGDWGFDMDFLIVGYLNTGDSQFGYVLVYHNSGRYAFSVATVDWLMKIDMVDFGHD
ncbi:hypothetical protein G9A89_020797 [Geosiphon pyriformis]|nr:hypothetical protein G9A89_020797 [Geosiphon pyriformis]